jgi:phosphatidylglycerophosphate synthase
MVWSQKVRAKLLAPLLTLLAKCRVTANALTFLSLMTGLAFCPALFHSKPLALALLACHLCFDALDGPLARHTDTASHKGSFTDTMSDQTVVAATTGTLIYADIIAPLPGVTYVFAYTVVVGFAVVRNALSIPYTWLVRPRLLIYLWFVVEFYLLPGSIDYVLWAFTGLLIVKMISGFAAIRRRM